MHKERVFIIKNFFCLGRDVISYLDIKVGIIILCLFIALDHTQGQDQIKSLSSEEYEAIKSRIEPFIENNLPQVQEDLSKGDTANLPKLYDLQEKDSTLINADQNLLNAKRKQLKEDLGLQLRGNYLENLEQGVVDIESGGFYKRRAQLGLKWDILKNGLLDNKYDAKALKNDLILNKFQQEQEIKKESYSRLFNTIIYTFNKAKTEKLEQRKAILDRSVDFQRKLFNYNMVLWDEVVETISKKSETQNMLKNNQNYNEGIQTNVNKDIDAKALPVIDINVEKVIDDIQNESVKDSLVELKAEILKHQYNPLTDVSLSTFLRYNIYNNPDLYVDQAGNTSPSRDFVSIGLSFGIPIPFGFDNNKEVQQARLEKFEAKQDKNSLNNLKEALNYYYEYQYGLNQYIEFYHKRKKLQEQIRQEQTKKTIQDGNYSSMKTLRLMENLSAVDFELYDIQQKIYLKLLNIYTFLNDYSINEVVDPIDMEEMVGQLKTERSLYVWASSFEQYENDYLINFLSDNRIKQLMLSLGPQDRVLDKAKSFIPQARDSGINVEIMIGNNSLMYKNKRNKLKTFIEESAELGVEGVHLDVEPHTIDAWDEKREKFLNLFIQMAEYAGQVADANDVHLGISIPLFYDKSVLNAIYPHCDQVFLMAYKQKDVDYLERKIVNELEAKQDKTVIALRPEDFKDQNALEDFMVELFNSTNISEYAWHDLEGLMNLQQGNDGSN